MRLKDYLELLMPEIGENGWKWCKCVSFRNDWSSISLLQMEKNADTFE